MHKAVVVAGGYDGYFRHGHGSAAAAASAAASSGTALMITPLACVHNSLVRTQNATPFVTEQLAFAP